MPVVNDLRQYTRFVASKKSPLLTFAGVSLASTSERGSQNFRRRHPFYVGRFDGRFDDRNEDSL